MPLRYLFGPVTEAFADQNLHPQRRSGLCLAFGPDDGVDLTIRPTDSWDDIAGRFPDGWRPDLLMLNLAYGNVPSCVWQATLPKVGLAHDWHLLWHYYRGRLGRCDLVLSDQLGAEVMGREGIAARAANLCGCDRAFIEEEADERGSGSLHGIPLPGEIETYFPEMFNRRAREAVTPFRYGDVTNDLGKLRRMKYYA